MVAVLETFLYPVHLSLFTNEEIKTTQSYNQSMIFLRPGSKTLDTLPISFPLKHYSSCISLSHPEPT